MVLHHFTFFPLLTYDAGSIFWKQKKMVS